jgi:hypothetical protein
MISRIWTGVTTKDNADVYETLLRTKIFPGILAKKIEGFLRIELLRRSIGDEVEFVTLMWFTMSEAVRAFAGDNDEAAGVPPSAQAVLKHFDQKSRHYEVREQASAAS